MSISPVAPTDHAEWLRMRLTLWGGVVYRITADNSLNPKTRYNALISLSSVGALPWYRLSFSTTLGL